MEFTPIMNDRCILTLIDQEAGKKAMAAAWAFALPRLKDGKRLSMKIEPESRRDNHNNHFHSLIGQIAEHVGGELQDKEDAKRILISAFRIDTRADNDLKEEWAKFGDIRMGRGLRGEVVLMGIQSRDFSIKLARAFIEWLYATGAEYGVQFKPWGED